VSDQSAAELREHAAWCRTLARAASDTRSRDILNRSAEEFESDATAREAAEQTTKIEFAQKALLPRA
jgi:hypothetical protein